MHFTDDIGCGLISDDFVVQIVHVVDTSFYAVPSLAEPEVFGARRYVEFATLFGAQARIPELRLEKVSDLEIVIDCDVDVDLDRAASVRSAGHSFAGSVPDAGPESLNAAMAASVDRLLC